MHTVKYILVLLLNTQNYMGRICSFTLVLSGIFIFQFILLWSTGTLGWIKALYIESTEKVPFSVRFQRNTSGPGVSWTVSRHHNKSFHNTCLGPMRLLLNNTFGGKVSNTLASVTLLCRTILYNARYFSRSVAFPSHLFSQNLISDPSLMEKRTIWKEEFLRCHKTSPKMRDPRFPINLRQCILTNVLSSREVLPDSILS
jgi:hypothetical protein